MKVIIIIGMTGTGKSPIVRTLINGKPCFIFDYQDEYGDRTKYPGQTPDRLPTDIKLERSRDIRCDVDMFLDTAFTKTYTVIVFEDATGFVSGNIGMRFKRLLTNKMFTKNTYVLCFHSIVDVPLPIMRLSDIVILLPTNDELNAVEKRFSWIVPYFRRITKTKREIIKRTGL